MKKYIQFAMTALVMGFTCMACDVETDEQPGGTNVQNLAGHWEVTVDVVDHEGNLLSSDPFRLGTIEVFTYNTSANSPDSMWISDANNFWQFTMKVGCNVERLTFACAETDYDAAGTGKAIITGGRVLPGAATNLHGMPNDSIVFDIAFSDDEPAYGSVYRLSGQKYTGFYE